MHCPNVPYTGSNCTGSCHCCIITWRAVQWTRCNVYILDCSAQLVGTIRQESGPCPRPGCCPLQLPLETCWLSTKMMMKLMLEMMMLMDTMRSLPSFPESLLSTLAFTSMLCCAVLGYRACGHPTLLQHPKPWNVSCDPQDYVASGAPNTKYKCTKTKLLKQSSRQKEKSKTAFKKMEKKNWSRLAELSGKRWGRFFSDVS